MIRYKFYSTPSTSFVHTVYLVSRVMHISILMGLNSTLETFECNTKQNRAKTTHSASFSQQSKTRAEIITQISSMPFLGVWDHIWLQLY